MEIIEFRWFGFQLQEPMAIVTNGILCLFCLVAYSQLRGFEDEANYYWKRFYFSFGMSTFFAMFGHAFFQYWSFPGKFPCWIIGSLANMFAAWGMLHFKGYTLRKKYAFHLVWIKSLTLLIVSLVTYKFVFVAVDAILTYVLYTGVFAYVLQKRGLQYMKWMVIGVIILFPSAFIFLLKINVHRWLNKDDLSHLLMLGAIFCFFVSARSWGLATTQLNYGKARS